MRRSSQWAWLAAAVVATAGCGGGQPDGLPREPISGKVSLDGQPLASGSITFVPDGFEGPPVGGLIESGAYSIPRQDGPVPGSHRVSVYSRKPTGRTFPDPDDPSLMIEETFESIPPQYNLKSELKADVTEGGANRFDFDLTGEIKSPPPPPKRPTKR